MKIFKLGWVLVCFGFGSSLLSGCSWVTQLFTAITNSAPHAEMPVVTPSAQCGSLVFFQPGASAVPQLLYYSTQSLGLPLTIQHGFPNTLIITDITDPSNRFQLQHYVNDPHTPPPSAQLIAQGYFQINNITLSTSHSQETDSVVIASPQNGPFFRTYMLQEKSVNPKFQSSGPSDPVYFSVFYKQASCVRETPQFGSDQSTSLYMAVAWQDKCTKLNSPPPNSGSSGGSQAGTVSICPTFGMGAQRAGSLPLVNGLWLDDDGSLFLTIPGKINDDMGGLCIGSSGCTVGFTPFGSVWICGSNQICQVSNTFTNVTEGDWDFWFVKWDPVKQKLSGWEACGIPVISPPNTGHMGAQNTLAFNLVNNAYSYAIYNPYYNWETNHPNNPNPNNPYNPNNMTGPEPGFDFLGGLGTFSPKSFFTISDPCGQPPTNITLPEGLWNVSP